MQALCSLLLLVDAAAAFTPPSATRTFATFGNAQTLALIQSWQPRPLPVSNGDVMLPSSTDNMKRFVRARILLEDPSLGCVASFEDALCLVLCRFSKAEHQLLLPLWHPTIESRSSVFGDLIKWHSDCFSADGRPGPRLSGNHIEGEEDRKAWAEVIERLS